MTKVDLEQDVVPKDWQPISDMDRKIMSYCTFNPFSSFLFLVRIVDFLDGNPGNHENALVGLVVIGRRLEEEKVTAMLTVIKETLAVRRCQL